MATSNKLAKHEVERVTYIGFYLGKCHLPHLEKVLPERREKIKTLFLYLIVTLPSPM